MIGLLPLVLAASMVPAGEGSTLTADPPVVTADGGEVSTVAPKLTPGLAPVLAPELVADGGSDPLIAHPNLSVYHVDLPVEATVTAGSIGLFVIVDFFIKPTLEGDVSCRRPTSIGADPSLTRCNPSDLTSIDRYAVGRSSREWAAFGDIALYSSILLPILYLGLESIALPTNEPWGDFGNDALVISEAIALTGAMQTLMKFAFRRPRPARYSEVTALSTFDQELSFPSGHTSLVAAATTAFTTTVFLRHPHSPLRWVVLGGGVLLTALTAISRVESGQHFPTDVMVGTLVGGFAGFAVPYLHKRPIILAPTASFNPATGSAAFGLAGTF